MIGDLATVRARVLDELDRLGLAQNTIVMYSTDNGAEKFTWPDGGQSPFRGEKNTNWEGGYRVPTAIRWPGVVKPGRRVDDFVDLTDIAPTFLEIAGLMRASIGSTGARRAGSNLA